MHQFLFWKVKYAFLNAHTKHLADSWRTKDEQKQANTMLLSAHMRKDRNTNNAYRFHYRQHCIITVYMFSFRWNNIAAW